MSARTPLPSALDLRDQLRRLFGYPEFRAGQEEVVRAVLGDEDVLAVMPTGAGKSLCYQLPSMLLPGCTVIISPLVALMKDQIDSLPAELRARAAVFNSTIERDELDSATVELAAGRLKLVYVAPERLRQRPFLHALARAEISRFVVDEAHCISLWGHDFRPDYLFIPTVLELLGRPPVLLMTATATPELQTDLRQRFGQGLHVVNNGVVRPNLFLAVERVRNAEEKLRRLIDICSEARGAGIVYVSSRKNAEEVAGVLRRNGVAARHYHAGLERGERADVQDTFMHGRVRVIVATVAFGMGVDKQDVRFIVHFNASRSLEAYAQESGRAGRDGEPARCILFWANSDKTALGRWARDDALTPNLLRAVYRAVRQGASGRFAWWPLEDLTGAAQNALAQAGTSGSDEMNETDVRVALGALEQVGVLRRHCDLPETAQIRVIAPSPDPSPALRERGEESGPPLSRAMAHTAGLTSQGASAGEPGAPLSRPAGEGGWGVGASPGERLFVGTFELAASLGCPPSEVEGRLLRARDAGEINYVGLGRGLLLELFPHPPDLAERLRALLDGHEQAQQRRLEEMAAYATRSICRAATIARHFGVAHSGHCGNCDQCRGQGPEAGGLGAARKLEPPLLDRAPEDIIIECVAELPFPMGRRGVSRVLSGSVSSAVQADRSRHFGALAALSIKTIEREIDALVEAGYLARDDGEYRLISVTPAGFVKEPGEPRPLVPTPVRGTRNAERGTRRRSAVSPPERMRARGATTHTPAAPLSTFDEGDPAVEERFARLREWRSSEARAAALPAYTILHDATLRLLASTHITSNTDLGQIKGIGPSKLERYGVALLELLREG